MMKDTGYINATKMCSSGGKEYRDWSKNKSSKELIDALENKLALENTHGSSENSDLTLQNGNVRIITLPSPPCKIVHNLNQTDSERVISGTYCHPLLIPHIACWVSPEFALLVSEVVNGYITQEYKAHLAAAQLALEHATNAYEVMHDLRAVATEDAYHAQQQVQRKDLEIQSKEHRHQVWSSTHGFTMLRLNNPDAKLPYYAVRCKRGDMSGAIKKVRAKHPHSIMIYQNSYVANPINLYNRLKNCGFLRYSRNYCGSYVREGELITKLGELCTIVK